ncbi:hypothetical protein THASP1DRAFT_23308 [Thamnocephalis sphaerospora]|uniref:Uncharacterized protein n=1 Tax=Thamnocephalis sphaerospora TaxID=78915 RepID=A0A4P9XRQ6_9FUNG|nr:hypothetical protein THASP1DRAFT_23308 [Thamnocephalis sphaerospora]|eukprot:RKP08758.1 hypothetical protein THASP1DRAFT_23308 [Thamnocephalis sphaerospora]
MLSLSPEKTYAIVHGVLWAVFGMVAAGNYCVYRSLAYIFLFLTASVSIGFDVAIFLRASMKAGRRELDTLQHTLSLTETFMLFALLISLLSIWNRSMGVCMPRERLRRTNLHCLLMHLASAVALGLGLAAAALPMIKRSLAPYRRITNNTEDEIDEKEELAVSDGFYESETKKEAKSRFTFSSFPLVEEPSDLVSQLGLWSGITWALLCIPLVILSCMSFRAAGRIDDHYLVDKQKQVILICALALILIPRGLDAAMRGQNPEVRLSADIAMAIFLFFALLPGRLAGFEQRPLSEEDALKQSSRSAWQQWQQWQRRQLQQLRRPLRQQSPRQPQRSVPRQSQRQPARPSRQQTRQPSRQQARRPQQQQQHTRRPPQQQTRRLPPPQQQQQQQQQQWRQQRPH